MLKVLFIIGVVAGIIIVVNTILSSDGSKGLFGFLPAGAQKAEQNGRPLETVPNLIETHP